MIIPRFNLEQTENTVTITIRAPYCSLGELDVDVDENIFIFTCKPYYLRLHLPGNLVNNDLTKSKFDTDSGEFTLTYHKETPGEHFKNLELITKFLPTKIETEAKISVVTNENEILIEENESGYGFGFRHKNIPNIEEFGDVFDLSCHLPLKERREVRLKTEQEQFNEEHYISDFMEDEEITELINLELPEKQSEFTSSELDFLKDISNLNFGEIPEKQLNYIHCNLVDILFAYCYERRTSGFDEEPSVEAGWTVNKLSASLSWFEGFDDLKSAITSAFRRTLIYPLFRNIYLTQTIFDDLKVILRKDLIVIVKILIEIHNMFLKGDSDRYILNKLFINDYILYVMKWDDKKWDEIVHKVCHLKITKEDLGLNLNGIESGIWDVTNQFVGLNVREDDSDDTEEEGEEFLESLSSVESNFSEHEDRGQGL